MWLRRIIKVGSSEAVIVPTQVMHALGWERGQYVNIRMIGHNKLELTKVDLTWIPPKFLEAEKPLDEIKYA